jgi:hypothetical protein
MIETLHSVLKPTRQTAHCSSSHWNDEKKKKENKSGITKPSVLLQLYDCCHFVWDCFIINEALVKELWFLVCHISCEENGLDLQWLSPEMPHALCQYFVLMCSFTKTDMVVMRFKGEYGLVEGFVYCGQT